MENESNKMTAVEFLIDKLINLGYLYTAQYGQTPLVNKAIKQAKEMEKEQKKDAWDSAIQAHEDRGHVLAKSWEDFEEYYAETYGKKTFIDLVSDEESKVHEVVRNLKEKKN
jgi:hypothetical protein